MRFFTRSKSSSDVPDFALPSRAEGGVSEPISDFLPRRGEPFSPFSPPLQDRSHDLILAKLDLVVQLLDNIDRRLADLEKIAKE